MESEIDERILKDLKQLKSELKCCCREARAAQQHVEPMELDQYRKGYAEALRRDVEQNPPPINTDMLKNVKEFNLMLKKMIEEKEQLNVHEKTVLNDVEESVKRLENRIRMVKDALTESEKRDNNNGRRVTKRHIALVRQKFVELRNTMSKTISAHFGIHAADVKTILQELVKAKSDDGYVRVNNANFKVITFLKEFNVVVPNPYDYLEVKLAF